MALSLFPLMATCAQKGREYFEKDSINVTKLLSSSGNKMNKVSINSVIYLSFAITQNSIFYEYTKFKLIWTIFLGINLTCEIYVRSADVIYMRIQLQYNYWKTTSSIYSKFLILTPNLPFDLDRTKLATPTTIATTNPPIRMKNTPATLLSDSDFFFEPYTQGRMSNTDIDRNRYLYWFSSINM